VTDTTNPLDKDMVYRVAVYPASGPAMEFTTPAAYVNAGALVWRDPDKPKLTHYLGIGPGMRVDLEVIPRPEAGDDGDRPG
jgi:hypothetical protein